MLSVVFKQMKCRIRAYHTLCLATYRLLNYTPVRRILFLVDWNNLARQTESEFSQFDRTEGQAEMSSLYEIKRLKHDSQERIDIKKPAYNRS